ncbi:hypothetical protein CTAM01_03354 [Colletotrichum tamarilloi]|uniref:Uncharacterized protein n=1 Tax=Colletotrichum tamarilloi TaxID=1209934 RepID=A0ABQ9RJI1_9PEZI|nr:uncharacterized protein CTAM01_03354 [Colletotrichum tamarilloi]KAK1506019.1 hypothetical protein CTAM01_03354 [Colletotrichum tamarilloi]
MKQNIPVVVIGLGRGRGISDIPPIFENPPYHVAACMDLTEVDEEYRYSPHNLGIILHNLHPRPRALLIGIAVDPSYTQPVERVWNEYVEKVLKLEKNASRGWTHFFDPQKPETWSEVRKFFTVMSMMY